MLRPWDFNVGIVRNSGTPIHVQIVKKIIEEIQHGRLNPGVPLPGTRELSNKLNINRKTVVQAYDELISQGWLKTEYKRGTFVSSHILTINIQQSKPIKPIAIKISANKHQTPEELIVSQIKKPAIDTINFSEDIPDTRLLPFDTLSRAMRHALISSIRNSKLHYNDPRGATILREAIVQMLNMQKGLHAELDQICIVRGGQMGIFLAARMLIEPNDNVVVEQLSNPIARETFKSCGANLLTVTHDQQGINLDALEKLCINNRICAIYVTPNHQIPTGVCMPIENRKKLLGLAERYDFAIIEDDSNHEFSHAQVSNSPIASLDEAGRVIYIGSLSKVLAPGFRIGYLAAPAHIIQQCASDVTLIDRQGNTVTELAIAELLLTGEIKRHTLRSTKIYQERSAQVCNLIKNELTEFASVTQPCSGLSLWLEIASFIDINLLLCDAKKEKLILMSPTIFSEHQKDISSLRLGFAHLNSEEITLGIKRLRSAFLHQTKQILSA